MIDPSIIDERITHARQRDEACTQRLLGEIARLIAVEQYHSNVRMFDAGSMNYALKPARYADSGNFNSNQPTSPAPENGSFAMQLWSSICFMVDARAELKLLELIQGPHFYAALMRSAAEQSLP